MEFRLFLPQMRFSMDDLTERTLAAESAGFSGIALMDHLAPPMAEAQPMYDAFATATWLAAKSSSIGIGHLVLCDAMRHPSVLAKEAVTLDHASGGRFELGIGWGSMPSELINFGVSDLRPAERVARFRETLQVLQALWTGDEINFDGEFLQMKGAQQQPTPLGKIPIVIGGAGPKTMKLVAEFADWWNLPITDLHRLDKLRPSAGETKVSVQQMVSFIPDETSRQAITETTMRRFGMHGDGVIIGSAEELVDHFGQLEQSGISRVYAWMADFANPETLEAFGQTVISRL